MGVELIPWMTLHPRDAVWLIKMALFNHTVGVTVWTFQRHDESFCLEIPIKLFLCVLNTHQRCGLSFSVYNVRPGRGGTDPALLFFLFFFFYMNEGHSHCRGWTFFVSNEWTFQVLGNYSSSERDVLLHSLFSSFCLPITFIIVGKLTESWKWFLLLGFLLARVSPTLWHLLQFETSFWLFFKLWRGKSPDCHYLESSAVGIGGLLIATTMTLLIDFITV